MTAFPHLLSLFDPTHNKTIPPLGESRTRIELYPNRTTTRNTTRNTTRTSQYT